MIFSKRLPQKVRLRRNAASYSPPHLTFVASQLSTKVRIFSKKDKSKSLFIRSFSTSNKKSKNTARNCIFGFVLKKTVKKYFKIFFIKNNFTIFYSKMTLMKRTCSPKRNSKLRRPFGRFCSAKGSRSDGARSTATLRLWLHSGLQWH